MEIAVEIAGWLAAGMVVFAYWLISTNKVNSKSLTYQLLNLIGGILFIFNTIYKEAYPSAFVNVVWVVIAVFALIKMREKKHASKK